MGQVLMAQVGLLILAAALMKAIPATSDTWWRIWWRLRWVLLFVGVFAARTCLARAVNR